MLTAEKLRELLDYDPATGEFRWRERVGFGARFTGKVAGTRSKRGYFHIWHAGRQYLAHRLAWLHVHGVWPEGDLDHRDMDKSNNRIENLRPATRSQNSANRGAPKHNSSGLKNVQWHRAARKWTASITVNYQKVYLGLFDSRAGAIAAHVAAAEKHFGEFAHTE
jgi:hypothetical protein